MAAIAAAARADLEARGGPPGVSAASDVLDVSGAPAASTSDDETKAALRAAAIAIMKRRAVAREARAESDDDGTGRRV